MRLSNKRIFKDKMEIIKISSLNNKNIIYNDTLPYWKIIKQSQSTPVASSDCICFKNPHFLNLKKMNTGGEILVPSSSPEQMQERIKNLLNI